MANNGHSRPLAATTGPAELVNMQAFHNFSKKCCGWQTTCRSQGRFVFCLLIALTLELFACKNSCDSNLSTIDAAGKRCINALHTRFAPAPPWRHRPVIICVVRSSKLSSGKRVMRLISSCFLASATSGFRSEESKVRSKLSKHGCTCANVSELRRTSSSWATPCKRWCQL